MYNKTSLVTKDNLLYSLSPSFKLAIFPGQIKSKLLCVEREYLKLCESRSGLVVSSSSLILSNGLLQEMFTTINLLTTSYL